jgi:hypothetical protein
MTGSDKTSSSNLVTLVGVATVMEAEVMMSMLTAYGIYASLQPKGRGEPYNICVVDTDLEDARALISTVDEPDGLR